MPFLRVLSVVLFACMAIYTAIVISSHGANLLPVFFENLFAMGWSGQFNLDFMCYLFLSALWIAWRHNFSANGILLGMVASVMGMLFFAVYLFHAASEAKGDMKVLLLGRQRAQS